MAREIKFRGWEEGKYEIGSDGSVWSTDFNHTGKRRQMRVYKDRDGYNTVYFNINGKRRIHAVRRLVALAFLGGRPEGLVINHKNGKRDDDSADNLEYITSRENTLHGYRVNGRKPSERQLARVRHAFRGEKNPKAKVTWQIVGWIRAERAKGLTLKEIASQPWCGLSVAQVGAITTNRCWI